MAGLLVGAAVGGVTAQIREGSEEGILEVGLLTTSSPADAMDQRGTSRTNSS